MTWQMRSVECATPSKRPGGSGEAQPMVDLAPADARTLRHAVLLPLLREPEDPARPRPDPRQDHPPAADYTHRVRFDQDRVVLPEELRDETATLFDQELKTSDWTAGEFYVR